MHELSIFYIGITYTLASVLFVLALSAEDLDSKSTLLGLIIWLTAPISIPLMIIYLKFFD